MPYKKKDEKKPSKDEVFDGVSFPKGRPLGRVIGGFSDEQYERMEKNLATLLQAQREGGKEGARRALDELRGGSEGRLLNYGQRIQRETALKFGEASLPLFVILIFAIVQGIRFGFSASDYYLLIIGSLLTILSMAAYGLVTVSRAHGLPKRPWMAIASLGGFVPYLFFLYLFFYRGLWSLASLYNGFTVRPLLRAAVFCLLSYYGLKRFYEITEIGRRVDEQFAKGSDIID